MVSSGQINVRGYTNGKRFQEKVRYEPYLFVPSDKDVGYKTLDSRLVKKKNFNSIAEARQFVRDYKEVSGFEFWGITNWEYLYIYDNFPGKIEYEKSLIHVVSLDIELYVGDGFPDVKRAIEPITAITVSSHKNNKIYTLGTKAYQPKKDSVTYILCKDEADLLSKFINLMNVLDPDIITGWNIELFDIPYLINRISNLLGIEQAKKLSPWRRVYSRDIPTKWGQINQVWDIDGITILDYLDLYRKFSYKNQESFKLDHIAFVELGENKVDYSHIGSLNDLYNKDPDLYYEYNIHDCVLVDRLEEKLGFINIVISLAYLYKCNYKDTLTTVKPWDACIHQYLLDKKIVIPQGIRSIADRSLVGGYVKDPTIGKYHWVVSFDIKSSYPHQIMTYGISPENFVKKMPFDIQEFFQITDHGGISNDQNLYTDTMTFRTLKYAHENNLACAGNGCLFKREPGFMALIMDDFFTERKKVDALRAENIKYYEETKDLKYKNLASQYDAQQLALKISINAFYGSIANEYCRWYSIDFAEAITLSGQLAVKWAEKKINEYLNKVLNTVNIDRVIGIDTDSNFLDLSDLVKKLNTTDKDKITNALDKFARVNVTDELKKAFTALANFTNSNDRIQMARESIADSAVWTGKKHYFLSVVDMKGKRFNPPDMKIVGLEAVKSSTPMACKAALKKSYRYIADNDLDGLRDFVDNFEREYSAMEFVDIASPSSVNGMSKYKDASNVYVKGSPMHVKASLLYNKLLKDYSLKNKYEEINDSVKIKYTYLKLPNPIREKVIATPGINLPVEFGLQNYIDYRTQFEKSFLVPLKYVTSAIGWELDKKSSLEGFFG